jgi:hypothetical protein
MKVAVNSEWHLVIRENSRVNPVEVVQLASAAKDLSGSRV